MNQGSFQDNHFKAPAANGAVRMNSSHGCKTYHSLKVKYMLDQPAAFQRPDAKRNLLALATGYGQYGNTIRIKKKKRKGSNGDDRASVEQDKGKDQEGELIRNLNK